MHRTRIGVHTRGRGFHDITAEIAAAVADAGVTTGLVHLFIRHTSASLTVTENADPDVLRDLESFMAGLVPDGDPAWRHDAEGPDDMPAHVRSVLTQTHLTVPVDGARLALGTWQGIFLWEHRTSAHRREVVITVDGA